MEGCEVVEERGPPTSWDGDAVVVIVTGEGRVVVVVVVEDGCAVVAFGLEVVVPLPAVLDGTTSSYSK